MQRESKEIINGIRLMMERMDNHYTSSEVEFLKENTCMEAGAPRSNVANIDGNTYNLSNPQDLVNVMSHEDMTPKKGWYVTIGYIESFAKLGKKNIGMARNEYSEDELNRAHALNSEWINGMVDNPSQVLKGKNKGLTLNTAKPDSVSNFIIQVSKVQLMYGRNEEYAKQKDLVRQDLAQYQNDNPDKVGEYLAAKNLTDFNGQSYDDARNSSMVNIPGTNIRQNVDDKSYTMSFNTPAKVFKKYGTKYYLIQDENTVKELSEEEVNMYVELFGVEAQHRVSTDSAVVQEVDKFIKDTKAMRHNGDVWTSHKLDQVFLLNFTTEGNGRTKLHYFNPNVIYKFVKDKDLKSGFVPGRTLNAKALEPHLQQYNTEE